MRPLLNGGTLGGPHPMANSLELDRLKRFSEIVVNALPLPNEPGVAVRIQLLEAIGQTTSVKAARLLVSDLLEWTQDLAGDALLSLDRALAEQTLPTLSLMRSRQDADLAAVLRRGRISTDDEYRLVHSRLADVASVLSDADRALGERLLADFAT
jgi:hypothetical protein